MGWTSPPFGAPVGVLICIGMDGDQLPAKEVRHD